MNALIDDLAFHEGCDNRHCARCMDANNRLGDKLDDALGAQYDRLGQYHSWLKIMGVSPETDGGWWSREALEQGNVDRFIAEHTVCQHRPGSRGCSECDPCEREGKK